MTSAKSKISLPVQMIIGFFLGIMAGIFLSEEITSNYLRPLGQLFITLIRMVVVPLVLATIVAGAAGIHDINKLGRVATKTLIYYFATTAIAITIGLIFANFFQPGVGFNLSISTIQSDMVEPPSVIQTIINIVPLNPIEALANGNMLQVIFFAVMFGFALSSLGEVGKPLLRSFELIGDTMVRMTNIVMMYAPIGVFGLISYTISTHGVDVLLPLSKFMLIAYLASIAHVLLCYVPLIKATGLPVMAVFKRLMEPTFIGFTTCSSAAVLPTNLQAVRSLGASKGISSFSIPLGNTINMDGTAIYMGVAAIFASEIYGIPLGFEKQLMVVLTGLLASIGTAGVPGAGLIMITLVFTQVGIPLEAVTLIAGIDRILDMIRTAVNTFGDAVGALVVSKLEGDLGTEPFDETCEVSALSTGTETYEN